MAQPPVVTGRRGKKATSSPPHSSVVRSTVIISRILNLRSLLVGEGRRPLRRHRTAQWCDPLSLCRASLTSGHWGEEGHFIAIIDGGIEGHQGLVDRHQQLASFQRQRPLVAALA